MDKLETDSDRWKLNAALVVGSVGCGVAGVLSNDEQSRLTLFYWAGGLYVAQLLEAFTCRTCECVNNIKTTEDIQHMVNESRRKKPTVGLSISNYHYETKAVIDTAKIAADKRKRDQEMKKLSVQLKKLEEELSNLGIKARITGETAQLEVKIMDLKREIYW